MKVRVEFSGGLELLFGKVKLHHVELERRPTDFKTFLVYVRDKLLKERPELFMQNETVRPGILVLINDTDWELEGGLSYSVQDGDSIVFISTLHGG